MQTDQFGDGGFVEMAAHCVSKLRVKLIESIGLSEDGFPGR